MKIAIENIETIFQHETDAVLRKIILEEDGDALHITIERQEDEENVFSLLTKDQAILLRDNLNTFIKNKLVDS